MAPNPPPACRRNSRRDAACPDKTLSRNTSEGFGRQSIETHHHQIHRKIEQVKAFRRKRVSQTDRFGPLESHPQFPVFLKPAA